MAVEITAYCKKHKKMERVKVQAWHASNMMMEMELECGDTQEWRWA